MGLKFKKHADTSSNTQVMLDEKIAGYITRHKEKYLLLYSYDDGEPITDVADSYENAVIFFYDMARNEKNAVAPVLDLEEGDTAREIIEKQREGISRLDNLIVELEKINAAYEASKNTAEAERLERIRKREYLMKILQEAWEQLQGENAKEGLQPNNT